MSFRRCPKKSNWRNRKSGYRPAIPVYDFPKPDAPPMTRRECLEFVADRCDGLCEVGINIRGSHRANGGAKTNGTMKAVGGVDKQRGHSRRRAGFNDRWDAMEKAEQQSKPAMMRDVWFVAPGGFDEAHFAVMPEEIARRCILAGACHGAVVLDPFNGSGTTGEVARHLQCQYIGIELNESYCNLSVNRWRQGVLFNAETAVSA